MSHTVPITIIMTMYFAFRSTHYRMEWSVEAVDEQQAFQRLEALKEINGFDDPKAFWKLHKVHKKRPRGYKSAASCGLKTESAK